MKRSECAVGAWLSLVERLVRDQEVGGSNPLAPTSSLGYPSPPHGLYAAHSFDDLLRPDLDVQSRSRARRYTRRMIRRISFAFWGLALLMASPSSGADPDDLAARTAAIASIKARQTGITPDCPKTRRKEHLEEALFNLRSEMVVDGRLNESHFVYEVVDIGCYTIEDSSLVIHTIDHPGTFGYVVVDRISGGTYRLWTDVDAHSEFNRLIRDLGVSATESSDAIQVADLYREVVLGPFEGNMVSDSFQVRQLAEMSFHKAYGDSDWVRKFEQWWRRVQSARITNFDRESRRMPEGWIVTGMAFEGFRLTVPRTKISGRASLVRWSLRISPNGQVAVLPSRVLFQQPAGKSRSQRKAVGPNS